MKNMMGLEAAVARYGDGLFRYCAGILCDWHEAQDAVQETFIKAYSRQVVYREDGNFGGWLYRIAYNTCVSMLRKKRFRPAAARDGANNGSVYADGRVPQPDMRYDDPVATRFLSDELMQALRILSPQERALMLARAVDDMDFRQMAAVFGASEATLRKRYERARKKMQQCIGEMRNERSEMLCQTME
ncbi:MAG: RNA polymerase sigma factor [Defluviitaleaceae bacterium]|nr:RNA polymerase sigma factor [Defluviitaleaceae bacterium]